MAIHGLRKIPSTKSTKTSAVHVPYHPAQQNLNQSTGSVHPAIQGLAPSAKPSLASPTHPTAAQPAPSAPAPAAPATGQKPEFDQTYFDTIDLINRGESNSLTGLSGQEERVKFDFGLDDPTNPFNRAEALKKAYLARGKAASVNLASRGHLYSGTHERAMTRNRFNEERDTAALRQSYADALNQLASLKSNVKFDSEAKRIAAFEAWLGRAPQADVDLPADTPAASAAVQAAAQVSKAATAASNTHVAAASAPPVKSSTKQKTTSHAGNNKHPRVRNLPKTKVKKGGR